MFSYQTIFLIITALCVGLMMVKKKDSLFNILSPEWGTQNISSQRSESFARSVRGLLLSPEKLQEFDGKLAALTTEYVAKELEDLSKGFTPDQRFELAKLMIEPVKNLLVGLNMKKGDSDLSMLKKVSDGVGGNEIDFCITSIYILATSIKPTPESRKWAAEYLQSPANGDEYIAQFFGIMRHLHEQAVNAEYFYKTRDDNRVD